MTIINELLNNSNMDHLYISPCFSSCEVMTESGFANSGDESSYSIMNNMDAPDMNFGGEF